MVPDHDIVDLAGEQLLRMHNCRSAVRQRDPYAWRHVLCK